VPVGEYLNDVDVGRKMGQQELLEGHLVRISDDVDGEERPEVVGVHLEDVLLAEQIFGDALFPDDAGRAIDQEHLIAMHGAQLNRELERELVRLHLRGLCHVIHHGDGVALHFDERWQFISHRFIQLMALPAGSGRRKCGIRRGDRCPF